MAVGIPRLMSSPHQAHARLKVPHSFCFEFNKPELATVPKDSPPNYFGMGYVLFLEPITGTTKMCYASTQYN